VKKAIIILATFVMSKSLLADELNPWIDYSVDDLLKYSSLVIDGNVHSNGFRYVTENEFGTFEICGFEFIVDNVTKNETRYNVKNGSVIQFEYNKKSIVLHDEDRFRIYIPQHIRNVNDKIRIDVKNQIHPELYGEGWKSDSPSLSAADILPRENEKPAIPKWYWLTGGVVSVLVFGGLTFLLGYLSAVRKSKV
jgi:hypothetical protein